MAERKTSLGPSFGAHGPNTSFWGDQVFGWEIETTGTQEPEIALRVGSTCQGLYVAINANCENENVLTVPAGATITASFLEGDSEDGPFEDTGPTICVKAPASGMEAEPGDTLLRIPLCDFAKPWAKIKLEFGDGITGGKVTAGLGYAPR